MIIINKIIDIPRIIKIGIIIQLVVKHNKRKVEWCTVVTNKRVNKNKKRIIRILHIVTNQLMIKDINNRYNNKAQQVGNH